MSQTAGLPPEQMRPLVHAKINRLTDAELAETHRQLLLLEAKREFDAIGEELGADWRTGRLTQEKVNEAVREVRATHPSRMPSRP